jgi:hypothetical protein
VLGQPGDEMVKQRIKDVLNARMRYSLLSQTLADPAAIIGIIVGSIIYSSLKITAKISQVVILACSAIVGSNIKKKFYIYAVD